MLLRSMYQNEEENYRNLRAMREWLQEREIEGIFTMPVIRPWEPRFNTFVHYIGIEITDPEAYVRCGKAFIEKFFLKEV
jgi:hypothetical protein